MIILYLQVLSILCSYHSNPTLCPRKLTLVHCISQTHLLVAFQLGWSMGSQNVIKGFGIYLLSISSFHLQDYIAPSGIDFPP